MKSAPSLRSGFTLIELLTVIAIIGILAAIIIPVVGSVRMTAQSAKTVSNLRQIQSANIAYAQDNKGFYVGNGPTGSAYSEPWFGYVPFLQYLGIKSSSSGDNLPGAWDVNYPEVLKSGRSAALGAAPRDDRQYSIAMNTTGWSHQQDGTSVTNRWAFFGAWSNGKNHMNKIRTPSRFITFFESTSFMAGMYDRTAYNGDNGDQYASMAFRNKGERANVVFADGHVAALSRADVTPDNDITNAYFWWDAN